MSLQYPTYVITAQWFDGATARRTPVRLCITSDQVEVFADTVAVEQETAESEKAVPPLAQASLNAVQVSERVGNTPYRLTFPGGALAVTSDHASVESAFRLTSASHWLARMERASWFVALALLGLGVALYFAWQTLIPEAAEAVANRIPRESEKSLGTIALKGLDRWMLKGSRLEADELSRVRALFEQLAQSAALEEEVELQFRDSLPNALALPGGTIVVTDGLVKLFRSDERLLAGVIAHELGHIHHRHSLRHLLEGSASALIVGALAGDVSGISTLTANAPIILSSLHYTRESEREADQYAFALLRKIGRSPKDFADAMRRFEAMELCVSLRAKLSDAQRKKASAVGDAKQYEDDESEGDEGKSVPGRLLCYTDPDGALKAHPAEVAELRERDDDRETGYMHTHPITRERIEAAEAAAAEPKP